MQIARFVPSKVNEKMRRAAPIVYMSAKRRVFQKKRRDVFQPWDGVRQLPQTVQPFCQRLAGALAAYGYDRIKVRGTVGLVMSDLAVNASLRPSKKVGPNGTQKDVVIINTGVRHQVKPTDPGHAKLFRTFASS